MSRQQWIVALLASVVATSGVTAVVVHHVDGNAVVAELQREDAERKHGEDEARAWMTQPLGKSKY